MIEQSTRYPDIEHDLAATIRTLDAVWIMRQEADFEFVLVSDVSLSI
jgi:hypothetical protein